MFQHPVTIKKIKAIQNKLFTWLLPPFRVRRLQSFLSGLLEEEEKIFVTLRQRPVFASGIGTQSDPSPSDTDTAIVLQGPLMIQNHFTLNSVLLYRRHYPEAEVIVSTWNGESTEELRSIEKAGGHIVLSALPAFSGIGNINYQIVSTRAGIKAAQDIGKGFTLKTRTDQRFYAPSSLEFLCNLIRTFPVRGSWRQKHRIVGHSLGTFKYRLYGISDMFLFGSTGDLYEYWQCPLDDRRLEDLPRIEGIYPHSFLRLCEVYLCTHYLCGLGRNLEWTLADSYSALADHFIVANSTDFDLFWSKYGREEIKWISYDRTAAHQQLDFREWLNIYCRPTKEILDLDFMKAD